MNKLYMYIYDSSFIVDNVVLPITIKNHCDKYKNIDKKRISISNYYYLCNKLTELGYNPNSINFINNKPITDKCYISLAHSNDYFGFVIGDCNLGFDLEKIISSKRIKLADKILNKNEFIELESIDDKAPFITSKWCLKEAYGKYLGCGITSNVLNSNIEGVIYQTSIKDTIIVIYTNEKYELISYLNDMRSESNGKFK